MTGADSPVIADSSTEAMPSITVPSPGISSPASTTTTSPRRSSRGRPSRRRRAGARPSRAHRAQRGGLRLAAALGQRLGQVAEDHRQPQPDRDGEGEPGRLVAAAERLAAEGLDQPADGGDRRRRSRRRTSPGCGHWTRGSSLRQAARRAPAAALAGPGGSGHASSSAVSSSRARFSSSTFTPGSPRKPSPRPSVLSSISSSTRSQLEPAHLGHACGLDARRWPRRCAGRRPRRRSAPRRAARRRP